MFLLFLLGCPDRSAVPSSEALPTPITVDSPIQAEIDRQQALIPDALPARPAQSSTVILGDCVDCSVIEPNVALRAICEGLGCP